jgi:hypothetical protein
MEAASLLLEDAVVLGGELAFERDDALFEGSELVLPALELADFHEDGDGFAILGDDEGALGFLNFVYLLGGPQAKFRDGKYIFHEVNARHHEARPSTTQLHLSD